MNKIFLLASSSLLLLGCVNLKYRYKDNDVNRKDIGKKERQAAVNAHSETYSQALEFIRRHRDPKLGLDLTDQKFIQSIQPTFSGSAEEAATALYYIKRSITEKSTDLEAITEKDRFDFLSVLSNNQILASHQLSALALLSAKKSQDPQSTFNTQINRIIDSRVHFWNRISSRKRYGQAHVPYDPNSSASDMEDPVSASVEDNSNSNEIRISSDYSQSDDEALFLSGKDDFNSDRYREATQKLQQVPESSNYYAKAREILKSMSNKMVPKLRSKAASAYQNSLPVTEPNLKRTYLLEARKYIQEAMTTYKYSDENALLRDNLAVIERELDSIATH